MPAPPPGRAAVLTVVTIVSVYMFVTVGSMMFAGLGKDGIGLGNPAIQDNVFFALARPVLGRLRSSCRRRC